MKYPFLHQRFDEVCGKYPLRVAIEEEGKEITYEELRESGCRLADLLRQTAPGKGAVITAFLPSGIDLVTSILAIWRSGHIYMPVQVNVRAEQLRKVLALAGSDTVITYAASFDTLKALVKEAAIPLRSVIVIDGDQGRPISWQPDPGDTHSHPAPEGASADADPDGSYLIFTSGTTGEGKPILGSHEGLSQFIHWQIQEFQLDDTCRVSQLSQTTFDASLRDIFIPLCTGGVLCIPPAGLKFQVPRLIGWLQDRAITLLHCVPSILRAIIKETDGKETSAEYSLFPRLQYFLMAGEPLYARDIAAWRKNCGGNTELVNLYGTSETTLCKTLHRIGELPADMREVLHAGHPIGQAFIAIMKDGRLCRTGEIGEIYIISRYISKGYYRDPEKTRERFVPNPLEGSLVPTAHKTGDLARYRSDNSIEVLGRLDDQVKLNGLRVDLNEVESAILQTAGITQVVIKALENSEKALELACYYTGLRHEADTLRRDLQKRIAENTIPAYFIHLDEFPLNINGKINKSALPAVEQAPLADGDTQQELSPTEAVLEAIWKEVFNKTRIGKEISFFSIGGTSLKAIRIISQVYKRLEVLITINDLFAYPTIGGLAKFVEGARKKAFAEIKLLGKQDTYELSAVQKRIWSIDQFADNKALYNVPEIYLFEGYLHREAFEKALHTLVERHEILRTTFELVNDEPGQRIHEAAGWHFKMDFLDYSLHEEPLKAAIDFSMDESLKEFDLAVGPLLKTILIRLSDTEYVFIFVTHHIVSDAWSQEIIGRDVLSVYEALAAGRALSLEPIKIQYKDFASWHNKRLADRSAHHRSFWLEKFAERPPSLNLPLDHPRPARQTFNADEVTVRLDPAVSKGLLALAAKHTASGFHIVLALINHLLYKYSGQRDIVIGAPIADRGHVDIENQVGVYFNTLPFRTKFKGEHSFEELLEIVKNDSLRVFDHLDYPFENILEDIQLNKDQSRNPLFDVGLTYISFLNIGTRAEDAGEPGIHSIAVKGIYPGFKFIKSDLWIKAVENGTEPLLFVFSYNTDLFKPAFATRLMNDFRRLAELVVSQPAGSLDGLIRLAKAAKEADDWQKSQHIRKHHMEVLKHFRVGVK
jgi:amino acid adenylation domain-containing protein